MPQKFMKSSFLFISLFLLIISNSWAQPHGGPTPSPQEEEQALEETESGYTPLDDSQITSNPQLQGLVFIGIQSVTKQAIQDGSLPEGNYQVSQIISAAQNQDGYRFEVEITDDQGNTADILFFITFDSSEGTTQVTSYEVLNDETGESGEFTEVSEVGELGEGEEPTENRYVTLDPSVVDTNLIVYGILIQGVQEATKQAIADGSLYDSNYQLADVYSVEQGVENPTEYKFDVSVINDYENTVRMSFDLVYFSDTNTVQVLSIEFPSTPISNEEIETEAEETFEETPPSIEETPPIIEEEETQEYTEDGFVILDPSLAQTDTEFAGILSVGVKETIKLAIAKGALSDSSYELSQVFSVQQGIVNPNEYRFNVSVRNSSQTVLMEIDLFYNESTNSVDVYTYSINVLENGEDNTTTIENGEEEEEESFPELNGNEGVDEIPEGYQEVDFDPNDTSSIAYQMKEAGLKEMVTEGVVDKIIPDSNYQVTDILNVSKKVEGSKVYYRFDLNVADGYGNSARFTYIVTYDLATETHNVIDMHITDVVRAW